MPCVVTAGESLQLYTALQLKNVPSKPVIFPDERHWIFKPQNSQFWYSQVLDWSGKHLNPQVHLECLEAIAAGEKSRRRLFLNLFYEKFSTLCSLFSSFHFGFKRIGAKPCAGLRRPALYNSFEF